MSGKLDWIGAYNRPQTLGPISTTNKNQDVDSGYSKTFDKEIKLLRAENAKLKKEYDYLNGTLKQLIQESSHEKFDERRVNLLKLQIIQLEKQVSILNEALESRHEAVLEVENTMASLANKMRSFISAEVKGPMVPIARADLMSLVESSESSRIKLFKAIEGSMRENVGKNLLYLNPFLGGSYKQGEEVTLLDISLNRMNYLNFRHVSQLESKLCSLYKNLISVFEQLENGAKGSVCIGWEKSTESSRLKTTILKTCVTVRDAADDLLALSLLCPSSPWPVLKRPLTKQVSVDRLKMTIPVGLSLQKQEEVNHIIESSIGVCNHRLHLLEKEKAVLKEELNFHRATHDLQVQYSKALFEAVRKGYGEFENSAKELVVKPIKNLLGAYRELKDSASEQALRDLLVIVKENEEQLSFVEDMFEKQDFEKDDNGASAFSRFGAEFFSKLDILAEQCQTKRDEAILSRKDVSEEQRRRDLELQQMLEDLEVKYEKQWNSFKPNYASSENEFILDRDITENIQSIERSEVKDIKINNSGSRNSSASRRKDDPTVLRSYLYSDNADNDESHQNSFCSTFATCATNDDIGNANTLENPGKRGKKVMKKKKWKPDQKWVSDFSESSQKNSDICSETKDLPPLLNKGQDKKSSGNDRIKSSQPDAPNSSELPTATFCDEGACNTNDSKKLATNKVKKPPRTYEPCLEVAKRTLKLHRAGSLSGLNPPDHFDNQNEGSIKREHSDITRSAPLHSQQAKHQQKPASLQKRNSWR